MRAAHVVSDRWTPDLAEQTARELGINLRPAHWHVLGCARELFAEHGMAPDLWVLGQATGLSPAALSALFPDAEHSIGWIAGVS